MKRIIEFPENWEEFTPKQLNYIFKKIYANVITQKWDEDSFRLFVADYLLGKQRFVRNRKQEAYSILVRELADTLTWMFRSAEDGTIDFNYDTLHNHFPKIGKLFAPDLSQIRFGEYRNAVAIYQAYNESQGDEKLLSTFVGLLYRRLSKDVEREPFNPNRMKLYEHNGQSMKSHIRYYVYLWFSAFNSQLLTETFTIDGSDVCFSTIFQKETEEGSGQNIGLNSILFTLADVGTFGNADDTDRAPLFKVLLKLLHDKNTIDNLKSHS
ncbi:MAG: hypothetical protein PHV20_12215 [Bacteroidales bacterium]|nr:hypothetical protein [Bacteroidales bacterium]